MALGRFHQVRDQIVAAFELDINLGERVFEPVAQADQPVVNTDNIQKHDDGDDQNYNKGNRHGALLLLRIFILPV
jgi:hypothetical protein